MKTFRLLTAVEQLANHLSGEILRGHLVREMPGVHHLAAKLGTSPKTVLKALRLLEHQGLLVSQGKGRRSKIVIPEGLRLPGLRIEIFLYEKSDVAIGYIVELKHQLLEAGHIARYSTKYLGDMGMDVRKVASYVEKNQADAWVVVGGSQPVLEWFAAQPVPALAMFGRLRDVPLAGVLPEKSSAMGVAVRRLVALGHKRIVMLVREEKRVPQLGPFEKKFVEILEAEGIRTGAFNLPDWQVDATGLGRCLDSLFQHTPPTALIIDEAAHFMAARLHLAQRGIIAPRDVSLICLDRDPAYFWSETPVSHIFWDSDAMARRIVQWADNVASGKEDRQKTFLKAKFIEGGTIGAAPARKLAKKVP